MAWSRLHAVAAFALGFGLVISCATGSGTSFDAAGTGGTTGAATTTKGATTKSGTTSDSQSASDSSSDTATTDASSTDAASTAATSSGMASSGLSSSGLSASSGGGGGYQKSAQCGANGCCCDFFGSCFDKTFCALLGGTCL